MSYIRHSSKPPDIPILIAMLAQYRVDYIITGLGSALLYGVKLEPGDLDIVPNTSKKNLERLVPMIEEIEGTPIAFGHWIIQENGEKKWVEEETNRHVVGASAPL